MADLRSREIRESYRFLISLSARTTAQSIFGAGMQSTPRFVTDGDGVRSALKLGSSGIGIDGSCMVSGSFAIVADDPAVTLYDKTADIDLKNLSMNNTNGSITFNQRTDSGIFINQWARIEPLGITLPFNASVVTREKGDARYAQLDVDNIFTKTQRIQVSRPSLSLQDTETGGHRTVIQQFGNLYSRYIYSKDAGATVLTEMRTDENVVTFAFSGDAAALIRPSGTSLPEPETIVTREKGDARYLQIDATGSLTVTSDTVFSGINTFNGATTFNGNTTFTSAVTFQKQLKVINPWDPANGKGSIYLASNTGNRIEFGTAGVAPPTINTRSVGTKIVLWPSLSPTEVDYALGIDNSTMWLSVPANNAVTSFKFYGGEQLLLNISGDGTVSASTVVRSPNFRINNNIADGAYIGRLEDSAAQPSFRWANDNTGFYKSSQSSIGFSINGTGAAIIEGLRTGLTNDLSVVTRVKGDARYVNKTGDSMSGGLSFGAKVAAGNTDLSEHISLWESGDLKYGFGITDSSLNVVTPSAASVRFVDSETGDLKGRLDPKGNGAFYDETVITREKGDARYLQDGNLVYTGSDPNNLNFPIGTNIIYINNELYASRSEIRTVYLASNGLDFNRRVNGTPVTGVWRARGNIFVGSGVTLLQRVG